MDISVPSYSNCCQCGTINSLKLLPERDKQSATAAIEFETKEDVLTAQTKDMKHFDGNAIEVQIGSGTTLYVCNFPPAADESYVRDKFRQVCPLSKVLNQFQLLITTQYGEIVDIRFPSLKYNTHRRFAYVQFKLPSQAHAATQLDGEKLDDNLELVAKISDPSHKQDRHGAMYEGRELFIANLPWIATWKDLKEFFSQYGSVEGARVPRKVDGSSKGIGFVAFRHKEDAIKALASNLTSWKGRVINVVVSTNDNTKRQASIITSNSQRTSASPAPNAQMTNGDAHSAASPTPLSANKRGEIQSRTFALLNIPDTVNDTRIRALVEPHGELVRVVLRPDHQGAIIEFKDQTSVGKASLALDGYEIVPGRVIRVGSVEEMKQLKAEQRYDRLGTGSKVSAAAISAPALVRRPGQTAGKRGGRGGLGIKRGGVGHTGDMATTDRQGKGAVLNGEKENATEASGKPRSNADFKAMMLGK